jgi:hypothetical protein
MSDVITDRASGFKLKWEHRVAGRTYIGGHTVTSQVSRSIPADPKQNASHDSIEAVRSSIAPNHDGQSYNG